MVEGFALRLAEGDVPPMLKDVSLRMLDVGLMQAGASVKGEFEKRLRSVIEEVQASETPVILFIDEAHTLIGAGGAAGTGDAANLLKPALARGELRTIAATTWSEYKQYIEKDPALTRRFQVVKVEEPEEAAAVQMLRGVAAILEKHHRVQILDAAIEAAVALSHRYIPARQLPDKAVSLLDTACARVAVSQHATPAEVEDLRRRRTMLEVEAGIIDREGAIGIDVEARRAKLAAAEDENAPRLEAAELRWEAERGLVGQILELRARLRGEGVPLDAAAEAPPEPALAEAGDVRPRPGRPKAHRPSRTARFARERPTARPTSPSCGASPPSSRRPRASRRSILPSVDRNAVAAVVQDWTGIPTGRMLTSQTEKALRLAEILSERVVGQDHAMEMIARRVQTSRAGLGAPEKPVGVFLLCGPSGVGKTETALALAETLYGGEQNLITINMSEFQEAHTVSLLKGAPPGYVGYGKGGVLTEAVRRKPYAVILLDEVEKAHPDVHEIFFQVFDKGMMDDSEGRRIDFKNALDPAHLERRLGGHHADDRWRGEARRDRGPRQGAAPAAPQGLPGRLPRAGGDDPLLSARRRHDRVDRPRAARADRAPAHGGPRGRAGGGGRGPRAHPRPLHRDRVGRPDDRRDPDQHPPARAESRGPEPRHRGNAAGAGDRRNDKAGFTYAFE